MTNATTADDDAQTEIEIVGPTTDHTTSPYGVKGCDEALHVIIDGEDVYVPWTGVRASGYDSHGSPPDQFDVDRIVLFNGNIHGDADVEGGVVEVCPEYSTATSEFRGYESWTLETFEGYDAEESAGDIFDEVLFEREH